jgi:hypothetical protein
MGGVPYGFATGPTTTFGYPKGTGGFKKRGGCATLGFATIVENAINNAVTGNMRESFPINPFVHMGKVS